MLSQTISFTLRIYGPCAVRPPQSRDVFTRSGAGETPTEPPESFGAAAGVPHLATHAANEGKVSIPEDVAATLDFNLVLRASICGLLACNGFDVLVRGPWVCGRMFPHHDHKNVAARHVKSYCCQLLCASRRALTINETPIRFSNFLAERLPISMRVLPALAFDRGECKDRHTELSKDRAMIGNGG